MVRSNRYPSPSKWQRVAISTAERLRVEPHRIWRTTILLSRPTSEASTDDRRAGDLSALGSSRAIGVWPPLAWKLFVRVETKHAICVRSFHGMQSDRENQQPYAGMV